MSNCCYHGTSNLYRKDDTTPVIALLGQPNAGKSTIFNMITGSHQHVGNWPGKTVDQKEGEFTWNGQRMILADLPGSWAFRWFPCPPSARRITGRSMRA